MAEFDVGNQNPNPTPKSPRWVPWIIVGLILVLLGGFFAWQLLAREAENKEDTSNTATTSSPPAAEPPPPPPTTNPTPPPTTPPPTPPPAVTNATITYTSSGFSPKSVILSSGGTLTIINSSGDSLDFASDPHPQHTINSQLNAGNVTSSKKIVLTTKGTFGVHNHDRSSHEATIIVQ